MTVQDFSSEPLILTGRDVTAVLGPTNTGKTHLAIERMVAHESGVIGLPLRLLAREVYQRVCEKVGASKVALVTGEEKVTPPGARYSVCTVEAMPRHTDAAFVAIDEIQLAADLERGHIFTDRILHLRGRQETLLLGAGTMRGILEKLLRGVSVVTRPRLSHLAYSGSRKLTRLPRRSAVVAFSADEVYAIAELVRRQRGGAAVVLGALSPRTRNAQVELFQSGDVDYLIATDAIGMGLNLDVDHVAFAQDRKFDGYQFRSLSAGEFGQIAGRAGRHLRDGTFGVTGQVDPLPDDLVTRIEGHDFEPVRVLQWRTARFDVSSLDALRASIETLPPVDGLTRALPAVDARALDHLARDPEIRDLAKGPDRVALLWDVCALPDYRRIAPAQHAELVSSIFGDMIRLGHVDEDYMAQQVRRSDSTDGEIDTLSQRIAQIRTWTYVSNRPGWLADPRHWQGVTREIEDRLSDALHERLTKRFVDRRTSVLMRRLRENTMLEAEIDPSGTVHVEGHHVGDLQGFRFTADSNAGGEEAKAVRAAAQKALAAEFEARAERFAICANHDIALGSDGVVRWIGAPVATLTVDEDPLKPRAVLLADEQLTGPARDKVAARIERYVGFQIDQLLKPLVDLKSAEQLSGIARGIAFRLVEQFGIVNRRDITDDMKSLDQEGRGALRRLGVRFGAYHIFIPALLKPGPAGLVTLLWALKNDARDRAGFGDVVHLLAAGRTSVVVDQGFDRDFYTLAGFRILGRRAVRIDILERLADLIRPALSWRPGTGARPDGGYDGAAFMVTPGMMSILGATSDDIEEILKNLGYRAEAKPANQVKARLESLDTAHRESLAAAAKAVEAAASAEAHEATAGTDAAVGDEGTVAGEGAESEAQSEASAQPAADATAQEPGDTEPAADAAAQDPGDPEGAADSATSASGEAEDAEGPVAAATDELLETTSAEPEGSGAADEATPTETGPATEADPAAEASPEEAPKPVLLWRPARFDRQPRHGQRDNRNRRGKQGGEQAAGQPQDAARQDGPRQDRNARSGPRRDKPWQGKGKPGGEGHRDGKPRDRREDAKPAFTPQRPREERQPKFDPDSPFAKLAALRDQLKK
jgi:ATP-dependent RNA helicase SUPV3L1/SUV3